MRKKSATAGATSAGRFSLWDSCPGHVGRENFQMKSGFVRAALASSLAIALVACGGGEAPSADGAAVSADTATTESAGPVAETAAEPAAAAPAGQLIPSPSWMPADWDQKVFWGAEREGQQPPEDILKWRQQMIFTAPFTLWAVSNDTLVDERFEPIWVWWTALRSCQKGIQMSEDLGGEFGDRARGKAALTTARNELKAWAATQPKDMALYFTATLGQWNDATGNFMISGLTSKATTLRTKDALKFDPYFDGATVEYWSDFEVGRQAINHFQASLIAPECVSADGSMVYKFEKMSQWWVVFGDVDRGMGGLPFYKSHELLPAITMTREAAAAFAQRNPTRLVEYAVTFGPVGSSFVKGTEQSAIRAKFKQVTITDALDGSVLASETY
jgi:hypothetical protein